MKTSEVKSCCGKVCKTNFCGECGRQLTVLAPLRSLLLHCRRKANVVTRQAVEGIVSENVANKWSGWVDALEEIISTQVKEAGKKEIEE